MSEEVDITGIEKSVLLAALFNASKPLGYGALHFNAKPMTAEEAQEIINEQGFRFDYLNGRVMKINISGDTVNVWGYDRDNGTGAVKSIVEGLRNGEQTKVTTADEAREAIKPFLDLSEETTTEEYENAKVFNMGVPAEDKERVRRAMESF